MTAIIDRLVAAIQSNGRMLPFGGDEERRLQSIRDQFREWTAHGAMSAWLRLERSLFQGQFEPELAAALREANGLEAIVAWRVLTHAEDPLTVVWLAPQVNSSINFEQTAAFIVECPSSPVSALARLRLLRAAAERVAALPLAWQSAGNDPTIMAEVTATLAPIVPTLTSASWIDEVGNWNDAIAYAPAASEGGPSAWTFEQALVNMFASRIKERGEREGLDWATALSSRSAMAALGFAAAQLDPPSEGLMNAFVKHVCTQLEGDPRQLLNEQIKADWTFAEAAAGAILSSAIAGEPAPWFCALVQQYDRPLFGWAADRDDVWDDIYRLSWLVSAAAYACQLGEQHRAAYDGIRRTVLDVAGRRALEWAAEMSSPVAWPLKLFFVQTILVQIPTNEAWRAYRLAEFLDSDTLSRLLRQFPATAMPEQRRIFEMAELQSRLPEGDSSPPEFT
jgi:hypothetical protein